MKPRGLIWMTDNITFQIPEIPAGLIEKGVAVPRRCPEIPKVRDYKKQNPKEKERRFWVYQRLKTTRQFPGAWCESSKQKEHAEHPPDRLPWVAPTRFTIMRGSANDADHQTND
jgi:hypothetical protein